MATRSVRARFADGKLEPLEPLELEEGCEVTVSVEEPPEEEGAGAAVLRIIDDLHATIPDLRENDWPTDLAENYKRYFYGPRKNSDR